MLGRPRSLNQRGDTIIEVLIVLAILGLALGISYATANRSLLDTRQAEESAQANELVQSQLEALLTMTAASNATDPTKNIFQSGSLYCIDTSSYTVQPLPPVSTPPAPTPPACNPDNLYNLSISYTPTVTNPPGITGGTFTVIASWPDVEGQGNDTVTLAYRIYQSPTPS